MLKSYTGPLDLKKMRPWAKRAYWIYFQQKQRTGVRYSVRDFIGWYLSERKRLRPKGRWDVARHDHTKPYSFKNIKLEPVLLNMQERNNRCGNPGKTHRRIRSISSGLGIDFIRSWPTMKEAMEHYQVSRKTIYNHCTGRTKLHGKYGPKTAKVRFEWEN